MRTCDRFNFSESTCTQVDIGMTFLKTITYKISSVAVDITNKVFNMRIRSTKDGSDLLTIGMTGDASLTGFYLSDPTNGQMTLRINIADTSTFSEGSYLYDIKVTEINGDEFPFMEGTIQFTKGIID